MPFYQATTVVRIDGKRTRMTETALSEKDAKAHLELSIRFALRRSGFEFEKLCTPWPPKIVAKN